MYRRTLKSLWMPLVSWLALWMSGCLPVGPTAQSKSKCPDQPEMALIQDATKDLDLKARPVSVSSRIQVGQTLGYRFAAKANQKLSLNTAQDLCIWIFAPDTTLVKGVDLKQTGKYIVQVAVPSGTTTFKLDMGLDVPNSVASSQSPGSATKPSDQGNLSQSDAVAIIQAWLQAKPRVFAPPWDQELVDRYTTGRLYYDITKPEGSIDWLRSNSFYYEYGVSRVDQVLEFSNTGARPLIRVAGYEERVLYGPSGVDSSQTGRFSFDVTYYFGQERGVWKIYDRKDND